ncbi:MAG TPA: hypothetical protein VF857_09960, partial [Spirochaetota bacterium]
MKKTKRMRLRRRMTVSFLVILLLMLIMGVTSFIGVSSLANNTIHILDTDARLAEYSAALRGHVIAMRQYEKDIFINIKDIKTVQEYRAKWDIEYAGAVRNMQKS